MGGYDATGRFVAVDVAGSYACLADAAISLTTDPAELVVIDVSDPTNCVRAGSCQTSGYARTVDLAGSCAFVADSAAGLQAIDVSDPTNPVRVGGYDSGESVNDVKVVGAYAYVADGNEGVAVIDVSDPANCIRIGGCDASYAQGIRVFGGRTYLAVGPRGLLVISSLPGLHFTVRVDGAPGSDWTIESATDLTAPDRWTPLMTTNPPASPLYYTDTDVLGPQKFYQVRED